MSSNQSDSSAIFCLFSLISSVRWGRDSQVMISLSLVCPLLILNLIFFIQFIQSLSVQSSAGGNDVDSIQMENFQDYDPLLIEYHHR